MLRTVDGWITNQRIFSEKFIENVASPVDLHSNIEAVSDKLSDDEAIVEANVAEDDNVEPSDDEKLMYAVKRDRKRKGGDPAKPKGRPIKFQVGDFTFDCPVCFKKYSTKVLQTKHIQKLHKEYYEEAKLKQPKRERNSGSKYKRYICAHCGKTLPSLGILREHETTHISPELVEWSKCIVCDGKYSCETLLKKHLHFAHRPYVGVQCSECDYVGRDSRTLQRHNSVHHMKREKKKCPRCGESCYSMSGHLARCRVHEHHKCSHCDHVSLNVIAIRKHIRHNHTNKDLFVCPICSKSIKSKILYQEHVSAHTGSNKIKCLFCDKLYQYSSNLFKHMGRAHPQEYAEERARQKEETNGKTISILLKK